MNLSIDNIKKEFPIFSEPRETPFVYLDNAASTQKPQQVIDAISGFYSGYYSNAGRGLYWPATKATYAYEEARIKVSEFINSESEKQIVFTSGATDGINKVARSYLEPILKTGDEVLLPG